jgi:probable F420-dependent oxidoreductase
VNARPFRIGLQLSSADAVGVVGLAQRAEAVGFDVVHTYDHVGPDTIPPLTPLAAIAVATGRIRLCPLVINNDFHDPVLLARDVLAIDHLSGGRMELGVGAGHSFTEYEAIGAAFDPAPVRKARLAESVELLRRLFDGGAVTHAGEHYRVDGVELGGAAQARLPILVGVNGRAALAHAVEHADVVGLTMLGRTLEDGQRHETRWEADRLDATIAHVRNAARAAGTDPEVQVLVQQVVVTDDRDSVTAEMVRRGVAPTPQDALATPFLAIGTHTEIAAHLHECRERWGISYFSVRDLDAFAPVIDLVR